MQSRSEGCIPARASALRAASLASPAPVSPSATQRRVLMPLRCRIHSSEVSIIRASSSLVTTRVGTWNAVAMNSVRGIGPRGAWLRCNGERGRFRARPAVAREPMDLAVSRAQYDAVRSARHVPDVLKGVLDAATRAGDGYVLRLTYEEATALNELCAWNVHSDARGVVSPESRVFDDLVKAILTHPEY